MVAKQKIVIGLQLDCEKCRAKAMKTAATITGVNQIAIQGKTNDELAVIGNEEVDVVALANALRKNLRRFAKVISVSEVKDDGDKEKKEKSTPAAAAKDAKKDTTPQVEPTITYYLPSSYPYPYPYLYSYPDYWYGV